MRKIMRIAAFLAMLLPGVAAAQCNSSVPLPVNTVLGRLGVTTGPCQAIPFSVLGPSLITSNLAVTAPLSITGLNLKITGLAGGIPNGLNSAFTATPTLGVASTTSGSLTLANSGNSGTVTLAAPSTSPSWTFTFPTTKGLNGQALTTDGNGNTTWTAGSGTVNSGTAGQVGYYASSAAALSGNANLTIASGALTVGVGGSQAGTVALSGATSGAVTLAGPASGGGTMTFPAASDTVMTLAATQTATNKTLTSPTLNSPTMTTPTLGVASATTVNKVAITAPATGSTLTITDGKTLTDTSAVGASVLLGTAGGGFSAYAGATCTNQFIRILTAAGVATCASVANTDLANSSITIGSTNVALGATAATVAGLTLTAPTVNGGTHTAITSLGLRSSGSGAFDVTIANTENLTAGRTLNLSLNNAARAVNLSGDITTAAAFSTAGANALTLTTTGSTNVTLPTSGTLAAVNVAQTFSSQNIFSALTQFSDIKFSSGKLYPTADSTTAMQFCKADGVTCFGTIDSTNQATNFSTLKFTTLDPTSLAASPTTITGLTVNNSPSSSNDYLLYYNAASGAIRRATVGSIAAGATAGVSSLNGLTGGLSVVSGNGTTVAAAGSSVTVSSAPVAPQGRLTLQTATPVMSTTQSGKTTIYYSAYVGNQLPIYDGANMVPTVITGNEISVLTTDATKNPAAIGASKVNDWFVWNDAGIIRLSHGPDWTSDTARSAGTALVLVNGIFLNSVSITNGPAASRGTWVGTTRSNGTSSLDWILGTAAAGGGMASLYVWNSYNQVYVGTSVQDNSASWSYTSTTVSALDASATNRVNFVSGAAIHAIDATLTEMIRPGAVVAAFGQVGIALDSTITFDLNGRATNTSTNTMDLTVSPRYLYTPQLGAHFISANQNADGANAATFFGLSTNQRENLTFSTMM